MILPLFANALSLVPVCKTAAKSDLAFANVFNHRHRLMIIVEKIIAEKEDQGVDLIEFDAICEFECKR